MEQEATIVNGDHDMARVLHRVHCAYPWLSLEERSLYGLFRVCCWAKRNAGSIAKDQPHNILDLWNDEQIQQTRRDMAAGNWARLCPDSCPVPRLKHRLGIQPMYDYPSAEYAAFSSEYRENREKVLTSILNGDTRVDTYPLRLMLHLSNICNLKCPMCYLDKTQKVDIHDSYFINLYKLMAYLDELKVFGGEPFACKRTKDLFFGEEIRKHPQLHLTTITNGTLLDSRCIDRLRDLRLGWFQFSLDSCSVETYAKCRGGDYGTTMANFENFVRERDRGGIRIREIIASFTIQRDNFHEISDFVQFSHNHCVIPMFWFVGGTAQLLEKMAEVKKSLQEGLAAAEQLDNVHARESLLLMLEQLPGYERDMRFLGKPDEPAPFDKKS